MPFHGKVAVLVDGSTTGAGERIAAFAQERKLAPVVGARTAGRLICCSVYVWVTATSSVFPPGPGTPGAENSSRRKASCRTTP